MEEGVWVEYEDLKAWVSSHHLVHEKYLMLQRLYERRQDHLNQASAMRCAPLVRRHSSPVTS